jgi:FtsP/CotA-like multicopper oxidase with cupredoxin domain
VVNGKEFDPRRVDAAPRLGEVEIWRLATDAYHCHNLEHEDMAMMADFVVT